MPTLEELFLEKQEKQGAVQAIKAEVEKQEKMRAEQARLARLDALAKEQKTELDALIAEQQADQAQGARGIKKYGFTGDNTLKSVVFEDFQENEPYDWNEPFDVREKKPRATYTPEISTTVFDSTRNQLRVTSLDRNLNTQEKFTVDTEPTMFNSILPKNNAFQNKNTRVLEGKKITQQGYVLTQENPAMNNEHMQVPKIAPWILKGLQEYNIPFNPENKKDEVRFLPSQEKIIVKHYTDNGYIITPIDTHYDKKLGKRIFTIDTKNIIKRESKKENEPVTPNPEKSNGVLDSSIEKNLENINLQLKNISDMKYALERMLSELK